MLADQPGQVLCGSVGAGQAGDGIGGLARARQLAVQPSLASSGMKRAALMVPTPVTRLYPGPAW
jgi:hypothetical protein